MAIQFKVRNCSKPHSLECWLEVDDDGDLALKCNDGEETNYLLWVTADGKLKRAEYVTVDCIQKEGDDVIELTKE